MSFIKKILIGPKIKENKYLNPAIKQQGQNLRRVWEDESENTFGILRITRIFLVLQAYIFPGLYIRHLSGLKNFLWRKLAIEIWVIVKFMIPIIFIYTNLHKYPIIIYITWYLLLETVFYNLALIFISDIYVSPFNYKRSVLLLMLNYIEVTLNFAVIYRGFDLLNNSPCPIQAIYYSFVTSTTLGYGDFLPKGSAGQKVVIAQVLIMFMFVILFVSYFVTNMITQLTEKNNDRQKKYTFRK